MVNHRENTPNAGLFITALRSLGYNNVSAINDIIDNSLDADATEVRIEISLEDPENDLIRIQDNGSGMDLETLDQALRLGSDTQHNVSTDLGKFGMGLSTASISIAKRLVVLTKTAESDTVLASTQDIDDIVAANAFVKTLGTADTEQTATFHELVPGGHGTIVFLTKCDRVSQRNALPSRVTKEVSRVFRAYIASNKQMVVNKVKLIPTDIFLQGQGGTIYSDEEYEVTVQKDGKPFTDTIKVRLGVLPDFGNRGNLDHAINAANQGFYVFRNNREIQKGATLGIFTRHPSFNRFRAELYFSSELDEAMGVNFQKNGINLSQSVFDKLNQNIEPQLRTIRKLCARVTTKQDGSDSHKEAARQIRKKQGLLNLPREAFSEALAKKNQPSVTFATYNGGRGDDIYEVELHGKTVQINWNATHPFYEQIVQAAQDNKDVAIGLDFLIYSMALAELRFTDPGTLDLLAEFKTQMSQNVNTLLR